MTDDPELTEKELRVIEERLARSEALSVASSTRLAVEVRRLQGERKQMAAALEDILTRAYLVVHDAPTDDREPTTVLQVALETLKDIRAAAEAALGEEA